MEEGREETCVSAQPIRQQGQQGQGGGVMGRVGRSFCGPSRSHIPVTDLFRVLLVLEG